jgi:hypothetical protein
MEPGPPSLEGQGATVDVFSVDGESFRISTTASQGVHRRCFLALMVGAPGYLRHRLLGARRRHFLR